MDISEYRKQYEAQLEQAAQQKTSFRDRLDKSRLVGGRSQAFSEANAPADDDVSAAFEVIRDKDEGVELRATALRAIGIAVGERPEVVDVLLSFLRDPTEPAELRKVALSALQQASFSWTVFAPKRPEYLDALRSTVDDKDADLRRRVIGILAREKDEYVQRRLLDGLEHRSKALVSAAKAIQFLGYDIHAEYFPILKEIIKKPPSQAAKKEAIRVLAADASSKDVLAEIFRDKNESPTIRNISAIALQSLAPDEFEEQAKQVVLDDEEGDQIRATCLSALTHFANPASLSDDGQFSRHVEELLEKSPSPQLKQATTGYMSKYSP